MDTAVFATSQVMHKLPAQRHDVAGRPHVDYRAVLALAWPFVLNSSVQAVLNLTDTWFIGRLSTQALAAMGAVYWLVLVFVLLLGGVGIAVQTLVAQANGGRRWRRAAQAEWTAQWGTLLTVPLFLAAAWAGPAMLHPFALEPAVERQALEFWVPRMIGAPIGVALWAVLGFFNGISRPRVTLAITLLVAALNAALNRLFIFDLEMGIAGSAWATNVAQLSGWLVAMSLFLATSANARFHSRLMWRLRPARLLRQFLLGFPMGLVYAADLLGIALFQIMTVRLGSVDGAATQIVMMLTSIAYLPAVGFAMTGTTLVGQSIGAGDKEWAMRLGNATIKLSVGYMALIGVFLAVAGPWLLRWFVSPSDSHAAEVVALGGTLVWIAAGYQIFDGLNLGSGLALRGAGDAVVPAAMVIVLSWFVFVPVAHALAFAPGRGYVHFLPQFGLGAVGGWLAALLYVFGLGTMLFVRWRSAAWKKIRL
ncbi:MAG TPA: MATE family efflux transporter [Steroidobacteraceae bacterium]|nr:MATE family efflux transporter [Steroidobacteraceae bacterium]